MLSWKKLKPGPGEIIILMVILLLVLIVVTKNFGAIKNLLFSPTAIFLAVVMVVEYLLLKGGDRSENYRREVEAAREKRRDDLLALREMETELIEARARLNATLERPQESAALVESTERTRDSLEKILQTLRGRI